MKVNNLYNAVLYRFVNKSFPVWQRIGLHVTPNHFYQPIPDTRSLPDNIWAKESRLAGIEMNEEQQLQLLSAFCTKFRVEYELFPANKTPIPYQYYVNNGLFELVDGGILYCMIRYFKPKLIIEIGSGNSTCLSAQAILKNRNEGAINNCKLFAVEPYPNETLKAGFPGLTKLFQEPVQNIPISEFEKLGENDILFIDSSHVLKIGSDVQYEFFEILPRLKKGVLIHIHDIFLPYEYPKGWIKRDHVFVNEQYLLQAFLTYNDHFEVVWAGHYMRVKHHDKLKDAFGRYEIDDRWPASFWIQKVK